MTEHVAALRDALWLLSLAAVNYAAGANPSSVTSGDFNGDSRLDLAFANFNNVSVLLNACSP